ncbi:MAG: hypothetical protein K0R21_2024 [Anaerocolumna sp.]|jgi:ribosomal protein S18 acetylase RimI-like enzyme|nr:hypothetical protein [Anaerocolumna sp.]
MNLKIQNNCIGIDWNQVTQIIASVGMSNCEPEIHKQAFENSYTVVFVFDHDTLIGFGRAISDGIRNAAIYDVAVLPEYQGNKIGKMIIETILQSTPNCNFLLFASPGKESFYEKFNFSKLKTGMALFTDAENKRNRGIIY